MQSTDSKSQPFIMNTNIILKRPVHVSHEARLEKEAVRRLLTFERYCRDNALWDEMRSCYLDDAVVNSSWFRGKGMEYIEALSHRKERAPHHIHCILVWTHGNRAVAMMETTLQQRTAIDGVPIDLAADAQMLYRLVRINGEWYIKEWTTIYEQDNIIPSIPNTPLNIDVAELAKCRPSCQFIEYLHKKQGKAFFDELPGHDRPESLEAIYEAADRWIQGK